MAHSRILAAFKHADRTEKFSNQNAATSEKAPITIFFRSPRIFQSACRRDCCGVIHCGREGAGIGGRRRPWSWNASSVSAHRSKWRGHDLRRESRVRAERANFVDQPRPPAAETEGCPNALGSFMKLRKRLQASAVDQHALGQSHPGRKWRRCRTARIFRYCSSIYFNFISILFKKRNVIEHTSAVSNNKIYSILKIILGQYCHIYRYHYWLLRREIDSHLDSAGGECNRTSSSLEISVTTER